MRFKFEHHNKILTILKSLNSELLELGLAYFGGGSFLSLQFGEYRLSNDIDFICPVSSSGYRYLRTILFDNSIQALFKDLSKVEIGRSTTDQYGIRMLVMVNKTPIKTEIIAEVRFELDPPIFPSWSPVACLSNIDCFTSKLLSNADRFMDDSIEARDLIDLAVLRLNSPLPKKAIDKAEKAYEVIRPLKVAIKRFQERRDFREKCFSNLQIDKSLFPKIIDGIDFLAQDLEIDITERRFN